MVLPNTVLAHLDRGEESWWPVASGGYLEEFGVVKIEECPPLAAVSIVTLYLVILHYITLFTYQNYIVSVTIALFQVTDVSIIINIFLMAC